MNKIFAAMLGMALCFSLIGYVLAARLTDSANAFTAEEQMLELERDCNNDSERGLELAKEVVEKYLRVSMRKYDPASKDELSYDQIIRADNPFKEYAEKLLVLSNNRYRSFDSLRLESVNYTVEYGDISYNRGIYTIRVSVLEEKKYVNQEDCGYLLTNHVITVEQENSRFYVKEDITDDYVDTYLREYASGDDCTIDDLIESDKE